MTITRLTLASAVVLALLMPLAAQAQSFNCRTAEAPDEILICQSPRLRALDEQMASLYFRLRNRLYGGERRELEASQSRWLRSRMGCGRDYGCIQDHYLRRINELRNY
jgi:uncharacterized protein